MRPARATRGSRTAGPARAPSTSGVRSTPPAAAAGRGGSAGGSVESAGSPSDPRAARPAVGLAVQRRHAPDRSAARRPPETAATTATGMVTRARANPPRSPANRMRTAHRAPPMAAARGFWGRRTGRPPGDRPVDRSGRVRSVPGRPERLGGPVRGFGPVGPAEPWPGSRVPPVAANPSRVSAGAATSAIRVASGSSTRAGRRGRLRSARGRSGRGRGSGSLRSGRGRSAGSESADRDDRGRGSGGSRRAPASRAMFIGRTRPTPAAARPPRRRGRVRRSPPRASR